MNSNRSQRHPASTRAFLVGAGIASLAAAVYLIREGRVPGSNVVILERGAIGGSLDAGGTAADGYSMRGSRMFGAAYGLTYDLLSAIPSLEDPTRSVTEDTLEFSERAGWKSTTRLIDAAGVVDVSGFGFDDHDRAALLKLLFAAEETLGAARIDQCFEPRFFGTNFWHMWASMFGFETWHSAVELRRYLLRFLLLVPELGSMSLIQTTRYNGRDSIVRPLVRWLERQGVRLRTGVLVTDLDFETSAGGKAVRRIHCLADGAPETIEVGDADLVITTLGSMTAGSRLGSMDTAPARSDDPDDGTWALWRRLAQKDPAFGRPDVFCRHIDRTEWTTFTVTHGDSRFFDRMERLGGQPAGRAGLVTLTSSPWMLTFHLYHPPAYAGDAGSAYLCWGYGLDAHRPGSRVPKPMLECSGREILTELYAHLGFEDEAEVLLASANGRPCWLPYTTSQFMPRMPGDRPQVVPAGARNFAFVGQYCEIPDDVVYTVEYSVHSALIAVATLMGFSERIPRTYRGLEHSSALVTALRSIVR